MKQIIHNACGTIALVHAIANSDIDLEDGVLKSYLEKAKDLSVEERGKLLEGKMFYNNLMINRKQFKYIFRRQCVYHRTW